jgi:hypothetical protein
VDQHDAHDSDARSHGLLPAVDEGLPGGAEQVLRVRTSATGPLDGMGDALPRGVRGPLGMPFNRPSTALW